MARERILVVEDEEDIQELIVYNLRREGFEPLTADTGEDAVDIAKRKVPDLILLDLMLPSIDGLQVCRLLKSGEKTRSIPIVMVTAKGEEADVVAGLELGADDYVTKPFRPRELVARVKAILRRRAQETIEAAGDDAVIKIEDIEIHPGRREAKVAGKPITLTFTEFGILLALAQRPGWVFTRYQIVDAVRGDDYAVTDRSVDVQIVGLRKKLGTSGKWIETVRGVGYRMKDFEGMSKRSLIWQLWPSYLVIVVLSILAVALYAGRALRQNHYALTEQKLLAVARILSADIVSDPAQLARPSLNEHCHALAQETGLRVTIVMRSGKVLADSEEDPARMDDHSDRPEIRDALLQPYGTSVRRSDTVRRDMMYVAVPITADGRRLACARVSLSLASIDGAVRAMSVRLALAGLFFAALAGGVSIFMARRLSRPLQHIQHWALAFAGGDHGGRLPASPIAEIDILSATMNSMADQLNERIDEITRQRDEQHALFACMGEGVLAVDNDRHLIKLNDSAARLFSLDRDNVHGQSIINVIRNADLHELVDRTLTRAEPVEGLLHILEKDRYLQVHGTALTGPQGARIGALLVLNDVTQLRKLERMRRDFVANVSHELKTPITSIKGFSETLLDGAGENTEERTHFLEIIVRQADRLQTIVEDLLTLSSIEHADDTVATLELQKCRVLPVLESAVRSCSIAAENRNALVSVDCPEELRANLNLAFMEQAVINMIDNAIKYSEPGTSVRVSAILDTGYVRISVSDDGPGIAAQHIERIFERFYRVDKSRSRKLGGTGLGLAIVKRIAIFHGGRVTAASQIGEGSTFTITLPSV